MVAALTRASLTGWPHVSVSQSIKGPTLLTLANWFRTTSSGSTCVCALQRLAIACERSEIDESAFPNGHVKHFWPFPQYHAPTWSLHVATSLLIITHEGAADCMFMVNGTHLGRASQAAKGYSFSSPIKFSFLLLGVGCLITSPHSSMQCRFKESINMKWKANCILEGSVSWKARPQIWENLFLCFCTLVSKVW